MSSNKKRSTTTNNNGILGGVIGSSSGFSSSYGGSDKGSWSKGSTANSTWTKSTSSMFRNRKRFSCAPTRNGSSKMDWSLNIGIFLLLLFMGFEYQHQSNKKNKNISPPTTKGMKIKDSQFAPKVEEKQFAPKVEERATYPKITITTTEHSSGGAETTTSTAAETTTSTAAETTTSTAAETTDKKGKFVFVDIPHAAGRPLADMEPSVRMKKAANSAAYKPPGCSYWHIPPRNFRDIDTNPYEDGRTMFTFVRHPYDRFMQSYYFSCWANRKYLAKVLPLMWKEDQTVGDCQNDDAQLNQFAVRTIEQYGTMTPADHAESDCMFIPQNLYTETVPHVLCSIAELKQFGKKYISPTAFQDLEFQWKFDRTRLTVRTEQSIRRVYKRDMYGLCPDFH
eukprot:CAMPEP_0194134364 /NCGR_PEP_ID=MMETSP0152-20130528/4446_1 /TAXON_ID=1049557 /ORGANISM="Thalassiothrix antarctica, Strain L6-D1" /LENGTH=394 /DNA_ID=CAMNT_0038830051 /DNA_START=250 /DNA_END=1434 /DNA_ORIENTATION=-